ILRGLVNIRGELHLCISLNNLLNLKVGDINNQSINPVVYSRMLLIQKTGKAWVFAVDEVYGIHRFDSAELRNSPKNMVQIHETFSKGFFQWKEHSVSYLDDELLFKVLDNINSGCTGIIKKTAESAAESAVLGVSPMSNFPRQRTQRKEEKEEI
ncbi:MAG: chemotaxis protein CheW, partial [Cyanobacteria bacterium P01_D01_bin.116]